MLKRIGQKLFQFYCHRDYQEDILGDLEEHYEYNLETVGKRRADRKYFLDAVMLFRFSLLRDNWFSQKLIQTTMVRNNIKMAYRSMMRQKFYAMLNLTGLAISMAACVFIAIYVQDELSYDKHFKDSDRIFRIANYLKFADNEFNLPTAPDPMAKTVQEEFPEVEIAGRTNGNTTSQIKYGDDFFQQSGITWADQEIMEIFNFPLIRGDRNHLLDEPNTVVLTETTAEKIFGDEDPIGKVIRHDDQTDLKVTGVIADIPDNTHFDYNMFITMLNRADATQNFWLSNNFITYVKLQSANQQATFDEKMPDLLLDHMGKQIMQFMGQDMQEGLEAGAFDVRYFLQPITSIHLTSNLEFELGETGTIQYVYMFSIIGFFVLLIACINFMNMATARASVRAKEVGIRKVMGSLKKQLVAQFLTESIINATLALVVGMVLVYLLLPGFNQLTDKSLIDPIFGENALWPYLIVGTVVVGTLAGIYPAFVLSSFLPVKVLKGEITKGRNSKIMRNALVVVQFATSIFLIIGSIFVYNQLDYLQNKDLGFNKNNILVVYETQLLGEQLDAFKTELERSPIIDKVSISGYIPATGALNDFPLLKEEATSPDEAVSIQNWYVDQDYAETYGLEILQGRFFDEAMVSDSSGVILNQAAVKRFGFEGNPIGQKIKTLEGIVGNTSQHFTVVGVMKDFHFRSMTTIIQPQALYLGRSPSAVSIKYNTENGAEILPVVEAAWDQFSSGNAVDFDYLDQIFLQQFTQQRQIKTIFTVFAFLAISIASLGLFGLAAYVTDQRKKEIGIRKVLGASTFTLLNLLFSNFTKLILISALLAVPFAYWYMDGWLSEYPFRIGMNPIIFVLGTVAVFVLSWATVGYQSMRAAKRNPVDNLRYE